MTASNVESLWRRLKDAGLVEGEFPAPARTTSPWFVRLMLGVAAWIAAGFLLLFAGIFSGSGAATFLIVGIALCAVAVVLLRRAPEDAEFPVQLGLALSLTGQGMVVFALSDRLRLGTTAAASIMAGVQAVLFVLAPNFIHRVWSAGLFAILGTVVLSQWRLHAYAVGLISAACAWIWLHEFEDVKRGSVVRPAGYGFVFALIASTTWLVIDETVGVTREPSSMWGGHAWIAAGLSGGVLLWTVHRLLARERIDASSPVGLWVLAAAGVLALTTLKAPGLAPAVLILLLGYGHGNVVLFGIGVAALLSYLSFYYYWLELTLLYKSMLIATTGLALLAIRFILQRALGNSHAGREHHA